MKFKDEIIYWGDISIVALEAIMSQQGDSESIQYQNVRKATEDIISFMRKNGLTKDVLQSSISKFLEVRQAFAISEFSSTAPVEFVPATLVAMCIKNTVDEEISDEVFGELIAEAYGYLSNYNFK
jgi:hypothetical protein